MAKKTNPNRVTRSKKQEQQTMSKQDIKTIVLGLIGAIIIILCIIYVPDMYKNKDNLKVRGNQIQGLSENELACNIGTSSKPAYRKLCSVDTIPEGYRIGERKDGIIDEKVSYFTVLPTTDDAITQDVIIEAGSGSAKKLAEESPARLTTFVRELLGTTDVREANVDGKEAYWYELRYTYPTYDDDGNETGVQYCQMAALVMQGEYDDESVVLTASNVGADESCFADPEALGNLLSQFAAGITLLK